MTSTKTKTEAIPVHIYLVLDSTGSMNSIKSDVLGGFNAWLTEQQAQPGKCRLTMIQFNSNNPHDLLYDAVPVAKVAPLTDAAYRCGGFTPLLDAEGWMINRATQRIEQRAAANKPAEAILFVTYTDGMENASTEFTKEALTALKTEKEAAGWAFTYLGVGHDAYGQAHSIGTAAAATRSASRSSEGVAASFAAVSHASNRVRHLATKGSRSQSGDLYDGYVEPVDQT